MDTLLKKILRLLTTRESANSLKFIFCELAKITNLIYIFATLFNFLFYSHNSSSNVLFRTVPDRFSYATGSAKG